MKKITTEEINSLISSIEYTIIGTMTHCRITMKCKYVFTGESACMNPAHFNKEKGEEVSYENAFNKIWSHLGFHRMMTEHGS